MQHPATDLIGPLSHNLGGDHSRRYPRPVGAGTGDRLSIRLQQALQAHVRRKAHRHPAFGTAQPGRDTPFAAAQASWPEHECAGWVVQNCRWEDNFQRLLIMSGPGTVRGCTFTRMGSNISLNTGMGLVGGVPSEITIADNVFIDVSPRPHHPAIDARAHNAQGQDGVPPIERLVITGNTFVRSGGPALSLIGIKDGRIDNNRIESPVRATLLARPADTADRRAIMLRECDGMKVSGNTLKDPERSTQPDQVSKSPLLGLESTRGVTLDGAKQPDAPKAPAKAKPAPRPAAK
jgi:hypothetical protein